MPATKTSDLLFSKERYQARHGEIRLHMSHFFLRYLHDLYQAFKGDLALAIVLGEISHHNTARFFSPDQVANESMRTLRESPVHWAGMAGCNAYSVSCATGIPRETVRRKVQLLKKRGWVEEVPKEGLRITQACSDHFGADYSLRFLNGLLRASRNIEALLAEEDTGRRPAGNPSSSRSPRRPAPVKTRRKTKSPPHSTKPKK